MSRVYCTCKKSNCLKKYCVCFNAGLECDPLQCRCIDCKVDPSCMSNKRKLANSTQCTTVNGFETPDKKCKKTNIVEISPIKVTRHSNMKTSIKQVSKILEKQSNVRNIKIETSDDNGNILESYAIDQRGVIKVLRSSSLVIADDTIINSVLDQTLETVLQTSVSLHDGQDIAEFEFDTDMLTNF